MKQSIDWECVKFDVAGGRVKHDDRVELYNQTSENIHPEKSDQNIVYFESRFDEALKKIKNTKIAGGRQKGAEEFTTYSIQSGAEKDHLNREEANAYFEKSIEWLKKFHGEDNLVQAIAHYDETTPHLHVIVSNLTEDKEKGKFYCSMKRSRGLVGLKSLELKQAGWDFQQKFYEEVSSEFGFPPPVKDPEARGKVTIASWKKLKAQEAKTVDKSKELESALKETEEVRSDALSIIDSQGRKIAKLKKELAIARGEYVPDEEERGRGR